MDSVNEDAILPHLWYDDAIINNKTKASGSIADADDAMSFTNDSNIRGGIARYRAPYRRGRKKSGAFSSAPTSGPPETPPAMSTGGLPERSSSGGQSSLAQTLDLFAHAIRNGESWSQSCQRAYDAALSELHDLRAQATSAAGLKRTALSEAIDAVHRTPTSVGVTSDGYRSVRFPGRPEFIASILALMPPAPAPGAAASVESAKPFRRDAGA